MPPAADQTPAIAYGLYDREPIRTPGGGLIMPDLPPEAHTKEAHKERLNDSASWAEIVLQDWFKRIAVFGVSAQFDIDRFERATQALWRLTAVYKSITAPDSSLGSRTAPSANATASEPATPSPIPAGDEDGPSANQTSSSSINPSSLGPRTAPSADAPASPTITPSPTTATDSFSALHTPHSALESSALATPHLSAPSVRAVPSCPTLSLDGIATYLTRTEADLAEAKRPTAPILDPTPTPSKSHPAQQPHPSLSPSPRSALHTPPFSSAGFQPASSLPPSPRSALATPPCPGPSSCVNCAEPFCASRQAVPFHHQPSVLKCDGTCRECSKTRACKFTPAYLSPRLAPPPFPLPSKIVRSAGSVRSVLVRPIPLRPVQSTAGRTIPHTHWPPASQTAPPKRCGAL